MKKSYYVRTAVAAALGLAAGQALALPPTSVPGGTTTILRISGATATNNTLRNLALLNTGELCQGNISYYSASNNTLVFCSAGSLLGNTGKLAIFKESNGGSANGVRNPANIPGSGASALAFITFSQANLSLCSAPSTVAASGALRTFSEYGCAAAATSLSVPDAGIADIDPDTFVGIAGVTAAEAAALNTQRSVGVPFAPIVSLPLYRALQAAQGKGNGIAITEDSVDDMPTLTSAQLRGIFSQNIFADTQLYSEGVSAEAPLVAVSSITASSSGLIHVCRRSNLSGTMTSFKIHFFGEGCSKGGLTVGSFVKPDAGALCEDGSCSWNVTLYGNDVVFAGGSSGNVRSCVEYHSSQGRYAVGIASTEAKPSTGSGWRWVATDGVAPTLDNILRGRYDFITENSLNWLPAFESSGGPWTAFDWIKDNIGQKDAIIGTNNGFRNAAAIASASSFAGADMGVVGIPNGAGTAGVDKPTFPVVQGQGRTEPISSQSREYGTGPNNCNLNQQLIPTP